VVRNSLVGVPENEHIGGTSHSDVLEDWRLLICYEVQCVARVKIPHVSKNRNAFVFVVQHSKISWTA
jgi:hypothetical protein